VPANNKPKCGMDIINLLKNKSTMIVVPVKEGENIERALKKFKRKFEKTGVVKELRSRQQFDKPSVKNRLKKEHAVYIQKLQIIED
jgi:small subunit ribosomal protein S21